MHKLRIGLIVNPGLASNAGGSYNYFMSLLEGINQFDFDENIDIVNIIFDNEKSVPAIKLNKPVIYIKPNYYSNYINPGYYDNIKKRAKNIMSSKYRRLITDNGIIKYIRSVIRNNRQKKVRQQLINHKIDLLYYLAPQEDLLNIPFITSHWDIGHQSTYPFPEIAMNGNYESRYNYYSNTLNKALLILTESDSGAQELLKYGLFNPHKVKVLPLFSSNGLNINMSDISITQVLNHYDLKKNSFFIYPAQFWAHKNHYNLITAFNRFKKQEENKHFKLVLCGSDQGNMTYIQDLINTLSLNNNVIITGFVTDEELFTFYTNATALVMPTFLGPTNMPLIEAAQLKCPVLCSDFEGHREILGNNALYFDPANDNDIENAMYQICRDAQKKNELINSAFCYINASKFQLSKSLVTLNNILVGILPIRKTWGT